MVRVAGVVQGVGFRPAIYRLARALGLSGFVRNDSRGVSIEIEGPPSILDRFLGDLASAAPDGARMDRVETRAIEPRHDCEFRIAASEEGEGRPGSSAIGPDRAPCTDCLRELFDPKDRRFRHAFVNCTACGPRYTIVREVPYDRERTTMAAFSMCGDCRAEYEDPSNRRFHAEPNACPVCGPRARLTDAAGRVLHAGDAAVRAAAEAIAGGAIVAVKGAGGFVLAVDARSDAAVTRLRERKRRPHKPFAVMARSVADAERVAVLDETARRAMLSPERPIVLVPARTADLARAVAPGLADIGIYLPPTPLQTLLLHDGPSLQVMTSGNLADEPIARTDLEARRKLAGVADCFLSHDREIHARADDSVVRGSVHGPIPLRRARGFVPDAIRLPACGPPLLAVGGHERNTVCLVRDGSAVLSPHVGHLEHPDSDAFFRETIAHLERLLGVSAVVVAHDLHPDYGSSRWALHQPRPRVPVQHHHAHVAACLAEHGRSDRVTGVAFDGTGLGDDGELWGGEILSADLGVSRRVGHLRALRLVGGEAAIRKPWRLAAAALADAGEPVDLLADIAGTELAQVCALLGTDLARRATGAGRWFDAVAAMLGLTRNVTYDGQAGAELEAYASRRDVPPLEFAIDSGDPFEIDLRPSVRELARELRRGTSRPELAARFHATLAAAITAACRRVGVQTVVLTGGCFQNRRLRELASARLEAEGFEVLGHHRVPPNDGGLALGQAAIASFRLARGELPCA
jgi:hydrogenase maturation protein HypF